MTECNATGQRPRPIRYVARYIWRAGRTITVTTHNHDHDHQRRRSSSSSNDIHTHDHTHDHNDVARLPAERLTYCNPSTIASRSDDDAWSHGGHPGQRPCPPAAQTNRTTHPSRSSARWRPSEGGGGKGGGCGCGCGSVSVSMSVRVNLCPCVRAAVVGDERKTVRPAATKS